MGICLMIYISEVKGSSYGLSYPLEREIYFDFDFDSSVRGGRGEAVCACETCLLNAGVDLGKLFGCSFCFCEPYLMLCTWVLTVFRLIYLA